MTANWVAAWICVACAFAPVHRALAEDNAPLPKGNQSLELSLRDKWQWTDIVFRGDRPKTEDRISSPEIRAVWRGLWQSLEAKIEIAAIGDRYLDQVQLDQDTFRAEMQIGAPCGKWTCMLEWRPRYGYREGFGEPIVRINYGGVKFRRRFSLDLGFERKIAFQATIAGGYSDSWPNLFSRGLADAELEAVVPLGGPFDLVIAPKIEATAYTNFLDLERNEILYSLRAAPRIAFAEGFSASLEMQYLSAASTRANKDGAIFSVMPSLRWTASL
jgi:hypothetical protein